MDDQKKLFFAFLLILGLFSIPFLIFTTTSLIARGNSNQQLATAEIPPYTEVVPISITPNPTQTAVQMNTFKFVTVTPPGGGTTSQPTTRSGPLNCNEKPKDYPADLQGTIKQKFGITTNGLGNQELRWIWEQWHCMAGTKFNDLVKGAVVARSPGGFSRQVGCPPSQTVQLLQYSDEKHFKFIITHELAHAIRNCKPRNATKYNEHLNAIKKEGAVSFYGGNAATCSGSDNASEDYADTLAYFVNPKAGDAAHPASCNPNKTPPNPYYEANQRKTEHLTKVAQPVLSK